MDNTTASFDSAFLTEDKMDYGSLSRRPVILRRKKRSAASASSDDTTFGNVLKASRGNVSFPSRQSNPFKRASRLSAPLTPEKLIQQNSTGSDSLVIPATPEKREVFPDLNRSHSYGEFTERERIFSEENLHSSQSLPILDSAEPDPSEQRYDALPPDLSLSSRVRFTLDSSRDNATPTGLTHRNVEAFLQSVEAHQHDAMEDFLDSNNQPANNPGARFAQLLYYWRFPDLPWINTFPRDVYGRVSNTSSTISASMGKSLKEKFNSAVDSIFSGILGTHEDKSRLLEPSYHILGDSFSVLLHTCSLCVKSYAVLSPSTRGLRNALSHMDIKFRLPLDSSSLDRESFDINSHVRSSPNDEQQVLKSTYHLQSEADDDEPPESCRPLKEVNLDTIEPDAAEPEPLDWLESIGLDKQHFPSLRAAKLHIESDSFRLIDYQPASTVLIEQEYLPKFAEFIKTFEKTISNTGPMAHVPPTILSRHPFLQASLNKLMVTHGTHRTSSRQTISHIDVIGPLLPNVIPTMTRDALIDLQSHQDDIHSCHYDPYEPHNETPLSVKCHKLTHPQVYNLHSCSEHRDPMVVSNFSFKNGDFYITGDA